MTISPVELFKKIAITRDMTDYNVRNILYGHKPVVGGDMDPIWKENRENIAKNPKYENTILGIYFRHALVRDRLLEPGYNAGLLKLCIDRYATINNIPLPAGDEIVLYFRLGDYVVSNKHTQHQRCPLEFNYIKLIHNRVRELREAGTQANKLTIVANMSFCDISYHNKYIHD